MFFNEFVSFFLAMLMNQSYAYTAFTNIDQLFISLGLGFQTTIRLMNADIARPF